jgi:hypothetical protein
MRRTIILIILALLAVPAGIVAYNVSIPPDGDRKLVEYAFPPTSLTANGLVLPAWRKPIRVVLITDEIGGNRFSRLLVAVLGEFTNSKVVISEVDLANSKVGTGKGSLVICVCRDIISAAKEQLSANMEFETPNEVERAAILQRYAEKGSTGFLNLTVSNKTREVEAATVYTTGQFSSTSAAEAMNLIATAISPQLAYQGRAREFADNHLGDMRFSAFGRRYLSVMLSSQVSPNMSRDAFEAAVRANP